MHRVWCYNQERHYIVIQSDLWTLVPNCREGYGKVISANFSNKSTYKNKQQTNSEYGIKSEARALKQSRKQGFRNIRLQHGLQPHS